MKTPIVLVILIAGSFLATPAWAGTPSTPEVTDAAGDSGSNSVDIISAWVTNTATDLVVTIKVKDLSQSSPALDNEGSYHNYYRAEFTLSTTGARYFVEGEIHFVDSETLAGAETRHVSGTVYTNVGTQYFGGRLGSTQTFAGSVNVDPATNTIVISTPRDTTFTAGAAVIGLTITTYQDVSVHEADPGLAAFIGGGRSLRDSTGAGRTYVIA